MKKLVTYFLLTSWSLICLFPLYWLFITSFKGEEAIMRWPTFLPFIDYVPTLDSWKFILFDASNNLVQRFVNSIVISTLATFFAVLLGGMLVYGLSRFRVANHKMMNDGLLSAVLATRLLPPATLVLPLYMMAFHAHMLDTRTSLVLIYVAANLPVAVWLLRPVFGDKSTDQEEAAQLDGASRINIFFTIFLPMVLGQLMAVGFLVFVLCWNEYLIAANIAGDHAMTLPPFLVGQLSIKEAQVGGDATEWPQFAAATVLMVLPLLLGAGLVQRALRAGGVGRRLNR